MLEHEKLNYLEFPTRDLAVTKAFFENAFGWIFTDYGEEYTAFDNQGLEGGFFKSEKVSRSEAGATLAIFFSEDLAATQAKVERFGGKINQQIFDYPGGRRFHFIEPGGSEFSVWGLPAKE